MANNLYQQLNQNNPINPNNIAGMMKQFNEFRQNFQGDPQQMVQQLLNSGKMSQAQYNQLSQMANQFMQLFQR